MRIGLAAASLLALVAFLGCGSKGQPLDAGAGTAIESGGTGGEGGGPTGTQDGGSSDNPAPGTAPGN